VRERGGSGSRFECARAGGRSGRGRRAASGGSAWPTRGERALPRRPALRGRAREEEGGRGRGPGRLRRAGAREAGWAGRLRERAGK
jgi:hypothetical protein